MPAYFVYLLKLSLGLSAVYLFYIVFFKRITYYTSNRYFLLASSMLACIMPFINVNTASKTKQLENIAFLDHLPTVSLFTEAEKEATYFSVYLFLTVVFLIGFSAMLVRLFVQLLSLWKMHTKATLLQDGEIKLYNLPQQINPFSYFNNVYINKDNYSSNELNEIINHELVHVQQKHTIDMLVAELICILNWFNPVVWLLKKAIKENLEFIADDVVINKGADKKNYQYLLLKASGETAFSIANNLNFSSLKNRIVMMNKEKSNKYHLVKFAFVIPVTCILLLAFRNKQEIETVNEMHPSAEKKYILSSLTYSIANKQVEGIVKKDQEECLLKTGEALNIELVLKEHTRLQNLLKKNGYENIGKHAIVFMVDTTLGNNSFSIQVNINLAKDDITKSNDESLSANKTSMPTENTKSAINTGRLKQNNKSYPYRNLSEEKYTYCKHIC